MAADPEVAADLQHVAVAGLLDRGAQVRAAAVDLVAGDVAERHPGGDRAAEHPHRQLALGDHAPRPARRHPGLGAPLGSSANAFGRYSSASTSACPRRGHVCGVHRHLAVLHLPGHPGVLAGHPHGVAALLDVAGLVEHQHPVRGAQCLDHIAAQVLAHPALVPHRLVQQPLHPVRRALPRGLRPPSTRCGSPAGDSNPFTYANARSRGSGRKNRGPISSPSASSRAAHCSHQPQIRLGQRVQLIAPPPPPTTRQRPRHQPVTQQDQLKVRL